MLETFRNFFAFCSPENRKKFYLSIGLGVLSALASALKIPAVAVLLQAMLSGTLQPRVIWISFAIMAFSVAVSALIKYRSTILQTEAGYRTACDKRMEIAQHLRYLPMGYFNASSLGQIASVTTNTMENLADVGTRVVMMVSEGLLTTGLITVMILFFDVRIGLAVCAGIVLYFCINSGMRKASARLADRKLASDASLVERMLETIQGIAEVKSYHLSGPFHTNLEKAIDENTRVNTDMETTLIPWMFAQNLTCKLIGTLVCLLSLVFSVQGSLSLLNALVMIIASFMISEGLEKAGSYSALLRTVDLSVARAGEILQLEGMDINGDPSAPENCMLEMKHVDFSYGSQPVLRDISLKIPEKTMTAFVGPSGSGKTTICHLLARFWDPQNGQVLLGGRDVKEYDIDALMKNFSFVFQDVFLFRDTIANNIRFGSPQAGMEEVMEAARKARCDDFIRKLPDGYDTVLAENGSSLSGGERQRLSIARAMMKDAPVVILDEATANVDPENEEELMEAIQALTEDKTVILIAHRLKTVTGADQIFVIDQGRIAQQGTHESLTKESGIYRNFIQAREGAMGWKLENEARTTQS